MKASSEDRYTKSHPKLAVGVIDAPEFPSVDGSLTPVSDMVAVICSRGDGWRLDSRDGDWGLPRVADYSGLGLG